jgi:uncharacterized membrane protein YoaK (UPF0700 family)
VLPEFVVRCLLVVLTAAAGCLDLLCLARLGGPFASVVTGNLVQLGHAIVTGDAGVAGDAARRRHLVGVVAVALRSSCRAKERQP